MLKHFASILRPAALKRCSDLGAISKKSTLMALVLVGIASLASADVITVQSGTSIDPAGGEEWDYNATGSATLVDFNALPGKVIQANWSGVGGTAGNTIDGSGVDVRIDHSPGFTASASTTTAYNSSSTGNGYQWTGTNGQQLTIRFGTQNGAFTNDRSVKAAGFMLMNFGSAYPSVTITYRDAGNNVLSSQSFIGGADAQGTGNGADVFSGYISGSENIAKVTIDISRNSGTSSIALDALTYVADPQEKIAYPHPVRPRYLPTGNYSVLFIAVDDLKANFGPFVTPELAAAMPRPVTPHLDTLAGSGMSFTRAYCQQAVCWASRISLMTGCRPDTTKIWDDGPNFRDTMPGVIALPQHFVNQGYRVAGYGKIYDTRSTPPNQDEVLSWPDGFASPGISSFNDGSAHNFYEDGHWQAEQALPEGSDSRRTRFSTDAGVTNHWVSPSRPVNPDLDYNDGMIAGVGITKLNQLAADYVANGKRFFLGVGFQKPHLPFTCPKSFWDLYNPAEINLAGYTGTQTVPTGSLPFTKTSYEVWSYQDLPDAPPINATDARRLIHGYLAATSFVDYQIGRVMAALEAAGVADHTIVVLWGDHGWQLGDHNGFWSKHNCFENATRSPLIIRAPGMAGLGTAGAVCDSPVEFVDVYPTLVDLAGIPNPVQPAGLEAEGVSLRALLEDPAQPWKRAAFSQYPRSISGSGITNPGQGMGYTLRTDRFRYTEWWRTATNTQSNGGYTDRDVKLFTSPELVELYDYREDPAETVNLAGNPAYASIRAELSVMLAGGNGWNTTGMVPPVDYPVQYGPWRDAHATPGINPAADLAPSADPDGDRIVNLMEYKMGRHPLVPDRDAIPSGIEDDGGTDYFRILFDFVPSRNDVSMVAERSATLLPGSFTEAGVETTTSSTAAGKESKRARIPASGGRGFLRLTAESN
jgi:iduronate 2-sulfatase